MNSKIVPSLLMVAVGVLQLARADSIRKDPTWWDKYQFLLKNGPDPSPGGISSFAVGANVDISNECGPQSETFITINPSNPSNLAAGSNEIFRLPMRGYFSLDGGFSWGGVDLPLPPPKGNGTDFGSDPSVAFDTQGNVYYAYVVVFFGNGNGINGTGLAVAKSSDGGRTYPNVTYFSFQGGANHFNDKPIIAVDTNPESPFRDNVYVAWNDYHANTIGFSRSLDGGATWAPATTVASKSIPFDIRIPAESFRGALVYPACDADRSNGANRGRLSCSWMDLTEAGTTDILYAYSDDRGATWSTPASVGDQLSIDADRFNHWLSVDPVTGGVNVSFYDTRNDTTGERFQTDVYLASSSDGGVTFAPNVRVTTQSSNEHDCDGTFPCQGINYGNQQGDYEGLASFGGVSHPVWTDSRRQLDPATGCRRPYLMEEVFTAAVE